MNRILEGSETVIIILSIIWIVAIVGIFVMKKIEPYNKIYPIYAVVICGLMTIYYILYI